MHTTDNVHIWLQVGSLDARLAEMAGADQAASAAQELLRSQLAAARAEAAAAEERLTAARAAHESKGQQCSRWAPAQQRKSVADCGAAFRHIVEMMPYHFAILRSAVTLDWRIVACHGD